MPRVRISFGQRVGKGDEATAKNEKSEGYIQDNHTLSTILMVNGNGSLAQGLDQVARVPGRMTTKDYRNTRKEMYVAGEVSGFFIWRIMELGFSGPKQCQKIRLQAGLLRPGSQIAGYLYMLTSYSQTPLCQAICVGPFVVCLWLTVGLQ